MLQAALILSLDNIIDYWVLDSRTSFHATPCRKYFQDYVQGDFGEVYLDDGEPCKFVGKGKIPLNLKTEKPMVVERGKAHSFFEKKSNFNRKIEK